LGRVIGQCGTAAEAIVALCKTPTDVVLLDFDLGEERGSSLVAEMEKCQLGVKILMVTAGMTDTEVRASDSLDDLVTSCGLKC
jgi:response regulator of citrate/malate metabolism